MQFTIVHILSVFCLGWYQVLGLGDLSATVTLTASSRCDTPNGAVYITASGGVPLYSYMLNEAGSQTSSIFSNLSPGYYNYTVTDSVSEIFIGHFTIDGPTLPFATVSCENVTCHGYSDGAITFNDITRGAPPYQFSANGSLFQDDVRIPNLRTGSYNPVIKDSVGCSNMLGIYISEPPEMVVSCDVVSPPTCATGTGLMEFSASGGTPPYSYSNYGTTFLSDNQAAVPHGEFQCYFLDAHYCLAHANNTMPIGTTVILATYSVTPVKNCTNPDGTMTLAFSGGTAPYQVLLPGTSQWELAPSAISSLPAGVYTYYVKDATDCLFQMSRVIPADFGQLTAAVNVHRIVCATDGNTGIIYVNASCGTPPYLFSVDNGQTYQENNTFDGLGAVLTYPVVVKDFLNQTFNSTVVDMQKPPILILEVFDLQNQTCASPGFFSVRAYGGVSDSNLYSFIFEGATLKRINSTRLSSVVGRHTISVEDDVGCIVSGYFFIDVDPSNLTGTVSFTNISCHNDGNTGSITINASFGTPPYTYTVDTINLQTTNTFSELHEGIYSPMVIDNIGCESVLETIIITRPSELRVNVTTESASCTADHRPTNGSVLLNAYGGYSITGSYSYHYINDGRMVESQSGAYWSTPAGKQNFYVTDSNGCRTGVSVTIYSDCCGDGYTFINNSCIDIDECVTNNGGCDEIVACENTVGGRTCGNCPLGYIGSGYSFCNRTCGDGVCNGTENCINCFRDCQSASCKICGDGYCDASIKEDCNSCFDDCGACAKKCPGNCNGHGTCVNGACICTGTWTDPACSTRH